MNNSFTPSEGIRGTTRDGQSLIETCLAMFFICLVFAGLVQVSQIFAAREILQHAALSGARAKTVGFNQWMVQKVVRVAAIPNAGKMIAPSFENRDAALEGMAASMKPGNFWTGALGIVPSSLQYGIERGRIPQYLASVNEARAGYLLDYADWETIHENIDGAGVVSGGPDIINPLLHVTVEQEYPLWAPMHQSFYAADTVGLQGESYLENHYPLYLDDRGL